MIEFKVETDDLKTPGTAVFENYHDLAKIAEFASLNYQVLYAVVERLDRLIEILEGERKP